jgi:hypothetical protein
MTALDLYATLGGNELVNVSRLAAYVAAGYKPRSATVTVQGCPGLATALACEKTTAGVPIPVTYTRPDDPSNPAPWYDPLDPQSGDFSGLLVTAVDGADVAPFSRETIPLVGDGASLGNPTFGAREIEVTALLIGRTCCSLQAGLRWLTGVLRTACTPSGAEMEYLECCPNETPAAAVGVSSFLRTMRRVGVTDGVRVTDRIGPSCGQCNAGCTYMEVQFTLTAGDPYSYGPVQPVITGTIITWNVPVKKVEITPGIFRTIRTPCSSPCGGENCPGTDPACPPGALPPLFPSPDPCGCQPISTVGAAAWIPPGSAPSWQQMVPVVTLFSGRSVLRHARVVIYSNPTNRPATELEDCDACAEFTVAYLESNTNFVVDARDRRFYVRCPGRNPSNGARLVTGADGRPFRWPVLDCGGGYTVAVTADALTAAADATFAVDVVPRTPA